jgi:hypothetical protein
MEMGFIERRSGRYRARYRDPLGRQRSETFTRKADAERFIREMQVDIERGRWIDPAGADVALGTWAEEFLSLARRLSPSTQDLRPRPQPVRAAQVRLVPHRPAPGR